MTGSELVTMCSKIIKRQDLDTDLLLMFLNQQRRVVFRSSYLYKLDKWVRNLEPEDGFVSISNLKQARYVEYIPQEDNGELVSTIRKKLFRLNTMQEVYEIYDNADVVGEPVHYIVVNGGLRVIPAPSIGVIDIFGEFVPEDMGNDSTEDILSKELPDAICYLGCAEYFDYLGETDKGALWRAKAGVMLKAYLSEIKRQMTDGKDMCARDPFGNLGLVHGKRREAGHIYDIDELSGGTVGDVFDGGE